MESDGARHGQIGPPTDARREAVMEKLYAHACVVICGLRVAGSDSKN